MDCEITLEPERFEANLRDRLTAFFQTAFKREITERFDNAEEMLRAWRYCFDGIEQPGALLERQNEVALQALLSAATLKTPILDLGLGTRAAHALDTANILTVKDLLKTPSRRLQRLRGVGNQTRREILAVAKQLRSLLAIPSTNELSTNSATDTDEADTEQFSIDRLIQQITKLSTQDGESARRILNCLLGLDADLNTLWPSQIDVANYVGLTRGRIGQLVSKYQKRWSKTPAVTQLRNDVVEILTHAGGVMTATEVGIALLMARGSLQDNPQLRMRQALATLRGAVEVERSMVNPRFLVQKSGERVLVALEAELATYGRRLGDKADELASEDPLLSPERSIQQLEAVPRPVGISPLPERRLLQLAAAASQKAALSSRQELYPKGMEAERALRLSQGALYGVQALTVEQIRDRVHGRYPEAKPLPERPALDQLLQTIIPTLVWDASQGCYVNRAMEVYSLSSSSSLARIPTGTALIEGYELTPEDADARLLEERLVRGIREGAFLALLVNPRRYQRAIEELSQRFPVQQVDFEALMIDALRQVAEQARVNWGLVLKTDATPNAGDWDKLMLLVRRAMPLVEAELLKANQTILLIYPGLLARYDQMTLLERLREKVGRDDGIPGLWVLVPNDQQALIEGQAVPLLSPGQRARLSDEWLENRHRAVALTPTPSPQGEGL